MLSHRLAQHRLKLLPMAADGNCQFNAMSCFFQNRALSPREIRRRVVHYIWANRERFKYDIEAEYGKSPQDYCSAMLREGVWGDGITLQAFGLLFNVNLWLFTAEGRSNLHEIPDRPNVALVRSGAHYDAAIPM